MTERLPVGAQRRFHRYVAILIAATSMVLAVVEFNRARSIDGGDGLAWAGYVLILGIGLAVSRQLAEMMGGSLRYVGGGTHHHFELLCPRPSPADWQTERRHRRQR